MDKAHREFFRKLQELVEEYNVSFQAMSPGKKSGVPTIDVNIGEDPYDCYEFCYEFGRFVESGAIALLLEGEE